LVSLVLLVPPDARRQISKRASSKKEREGKKVRKRKEGKKDRKSRKRKERGGIQ
jgi:hypothetical protein